MSSAASPSPLDVLRDYVERAADWGDAGVGHSEAMDAYLAEGLRALDELQALLDAKSPVAGERAEAATSARSNTAARIVHKTTCAL